MTYEDALSLAYAQLPVFHRDGRSAITPGLTNTIRFCEHLGNPQNQFKSIHVAGTNGKGSTCHMLAAILQCAGYKVGLYTSPHLKNFTERIRVNGIEIERQRVADFIEKNEPEFNRIGLSFFELTVGMAFEEFARQRVDIAIIETGLGGLLDSTNVILPQVSIITNVTFDHMDVLGDSLLSIAAQKAGIIKQNISVVISQHDETLLPIFKEVAQNKDAPLVVASLRFIVEDYTMINGRMRVVINDLTSTRTTYDLELIGLYQRFNLPGVLQTIELLIQKGFVIKKSQIKEGLMKTVSLTGIKGRWQRIGDKPTTFCDTGHNEAGLSAIIECIRSLSYAQLWIVFGCVRDKDVSKLIQLLPLNSKYVFSQANSPRAYNYIELQAFAASFSLVGPAIANVNDALAHVQNHAQPEDLVVVCGSTYLVAEVDNL